ncbi:hypothetical protein UlMin_025053 [Ulmus minor]
MENMLYAEELVREFLVFRGFTKRLQAFDSELSTDIGKGFQVDKIKDLIFSVYVPTFQAEKLVDLLNFFKHRLSSASERVYVDTLRKLEVSILRYYIVHAKGSGLDAVVCSPDRLLLERSRAANCEKRVAHKEEMDPEKLLLETSKLNVSGGNNGSGPNNLNEIVESTRALGSQPELSVSKSGYDSSSPSDLQGRDSGISDSSLLLQDSYDVDNGREIHVEELPEVKVDFQETFLGHTSPISRCRFSASGNNIASASVVGTVRNATIYCGAEILSLDGECKSDRLLLIGTADGGIKAWNVDAKRVVCDLNTTEAFPSVLDIKCSPVEPIFVSAAASRRPGASCIDNLGFASLTVWNMFCDLESSKHCRHEMALDANGKRLLVTSSSVRAPTYQNGLKTLPHTAAITTIDWHPTLPIFLTGSADNSVRVTSIL